MDVILLRKVENLGQIGDKAAVKPGYARNYLIPQGMALPATADNLKEFEARRAELEKVAAEELAVARGRAGSLEGGEYTIAANAGPGGKLFGSIGPQDIADVITQTGVEVRKSEVRIAEAFRQIGQFDVIIHLHSDVDVEVKLNVVEADGE